MSIDVLKMKKWNKSFQIIGRPSYFCSFVSLIFSHFYSSRYQKQNKIKQNLFDQSITLAKLIEQTLSKHK